MGRTWNEVLLLLSGGSDCVCGNNCEVFVQLIEYQDKTFAVVDKNGQRHEFSHENLMLIFCVQNCNIELNDLAEAIISMRDNGHNVAHFGAFGSLIYTRCDREYIRPAC